jgi:hypothetical protein
MKSPVKRRLLLAVLALCPLTAATTAPPAPNQSNTNSGEPIELFAVMMPVFTHPRCANCHGGMNPYDPERNFVAAVRHPGGVRDQTECPECHDATQQIRDAWRVALHDSLRFLGKDAKQMCEMQSAEVDRRSRQSYYRHLENDTLITQAFDGMAGGARDPDPPDKPPMNHNDFLAAARNWLQAGAGCGGWVGTIKQTEAFASNYGFPTPGTSVTTTVKESANRTVIISRDHRSTTADITMSGHKVQTSVDPSECQTTVILSADWNNDNAAKRADAGVSFKIAPDGTYVIHFRGPPEKTSGTDGMVTTSSCGSLLGPQQSTTDLDWDQWQFNIRCPAKPPIDTARGESIDCDLFDAEKSPRLKGRMTRVVQDMWDAADRQSWLAVSPASTGRADTGKSLPVTVVTEWDFELDNLSPDASQLRQ